ncbi:MAG: alcohol dehydrogenase catalytic domain-containing protein [Chloroflexota bacterium]
MRSLVWEGPRIMTMHNGPELEPEADEVVIKVSYAGICGSELSGYLGHNALRVPPVVMGHEFSGEIVSVGSDVQAQYAPLSVGKAVTANPLIDCNTCEYCQRGVNHLCLSRQLIGAHRPGAYAEYVSVPAKMVSVLPDGLSLRLGALVEPVGVGVRIGEMAGDVQGQDVLIVGAGPIGLLALQVLQTKGAKRVFIADLSPERLAMGEALGGEILNPASVDVVQSVLDATGGRGVSVSVDAVGLAVTRTQCVSATCATGTLILSGLHEETSEVPAADIIRREIVVRGCFAYSPDNFAEAIQLLLEDKIRLDPWIVEAPLTEGGPWFDRLIDEPGDVSKVLLVP